MAKRDLDEIGEPLKQADRLRRAALKNQAEASQLAKSRAAA